MTFSYIYGIGVLGCLGFYCLLSLMASNVNVTLSNVISVLGYCLLPMVVLSGINVLITIQWVKKDVIYGAFAFTQLSLQGNYRNSSDSAFNTLVCIVSFEAFRYRALDGSPANLGRLSSCLILRSLRTHYYLLEAWVDRERGGLMSTSIWNKVEKFK